MGSARRSDARTNYDRIIAATDSLLRYRGADISMEKVARKAQVSDATLYRHFLKKDALLGAALAARASRMYDDIETGTRSDDPGAATLEFFARLVVDNP
jgi:AcrR family transcriptional regulator